MQARDLRGQHFAGDGQVAQVSLRVRRIGEAVARRIDRRKIVAPLLVADIDDPLAGKQHPVASVARRHHAIEHIHAALDRFEQVYRRSDSHQVTRPVDRQDSVHQFDHFVHYRRRLADGQSPDRIPVGVELLHEFGGTRPQIRIGTSLHDRKKRLAVTVLRPRRGIPLETTFEPPAGQIQRFGRIIVRSVPGRTFIERHHDIGPDTPLHVHHALRRKQVFRPVDVRTETAPFLGDFAALGQRKDLKTAAIGQYRPLPPAETVQAAGPFEDFGARPQVQVIGIPQNDLRAHLLLQVAVENALDASDRSYGHKNRRFDRPVTGRDYPGARCTVRIGMYEFKIHEGQR